LDHAHRVTEAKDIKPRSDVPLVGIAAVRVAKYLDRPQIVERLSSHQLKLHEFDQWAGSLQENLQFLIDERLEQLLPNIQVIAAPWPRSLEPDYQLSVMIRQFDIGGNNVQLQALWNLTGADRKELLILQRMAHTEAIDKPGIEAGVAAANRAITRLAQVIASQLQSKVVNGTFE
jgi:uncharacterized lipoprotein YmbA